MTRREHYLKAEELLDCADAAATETWEEAAYFTAAALVHATLANVSLMLDTGAVIIELA